MIRLRHLRLRSITARSSFGADIPFHRGLNIIQAPNTSGKSTCLQSVIYALGLEKALGPQLSVPLPYAMRERIHEARDADYQDVVQSFVALEIKNATGDVVVVRRDVIGGKNTKLIRTWRGATLSKNEEATDERDYYVLDGGAAVNDSGFHFFLSRFMGWNLPVVTRFDGTECPLYLEAIFPMLFVEQKRGWSAVQGPFPTFFRIQDVIRRVMEFLLDLEAARNRRLRAELRAGLSDLINRWNDHRKTFEEAASRIGRLRGVPQSPSAEFASESAVNLQIFYQDEWMPLDQALSVIGEIIGQLEAAQLQTVESASPELEAQAEALKRQIDEQRAIIETVRNEFSAETQDERALKSRLSGLEEDLRKNQDAQKLQRLGSELGSAAFEKICPTCHQGISSELLPSVESVSMALDENVLFIKSQLELFRAALTTSEGRKLEIAARYRGLEQSLKRKQQELRSIRQDLMRPSEAISRAAIEQIVRLGSFRERLKSVADMAMASMDTLKKIATDWVHVSEALRRLPSDELTLADKRKLEQIEISLKEQLLKYGFKSFRPSELSLSNDNFRPLIISGPANDLIEKEINFEISASDAIRLKWAYYLAPLALAKTYHLNHPGLVIFDEPGQQEMDEASLLSFLREASQIVGSSGQIVVSTSVSRETLAAAFPPPERLNIVHFMGFILQPINL